jgi:hypothetical protein
VTTPVSIRHRQLHFMRSGIEGTHRQHSLEHKFTISRESHPAVKLCELATEMPDFKRSGRLLKEYLDKTTAQFGS